MKVSVNDQYGRVRYSLIIRILPLGWWSVSPLVIVILQKELFQVNSEIHQTVTIKLQPLLVEAVAKLLIASLPNCNCLMYKLICNIQR